ncbi:MAG: hypothetical protein GX992_01390 [Clostridium sp.]|nr:hypothetical protein [Clostridium sp.]
MFKKLVSLITVAVILSFLLTFFSIPVSSSDVSPCYLYTYSAFSTLTISGTTATCTSTAKGYIGLTTKVYTYQALEKKNSNNSWSLVESWGKNDIGYIGSATNVKSGLAPGTYRLRTSFTVYAGSEYEIVEVLSFEKTI